MSTKKIDNQSLVSEGGDRYVDWVAWTIKEEGDTLFVKCVGRSKISRIVVFLIITAGSVIFYEYFPIGYKFIILVLYPIFLLMYFIIVGIEFGYQMQGDWLMFEEKTNQICLPRIHVSFDKSQLVFFQVITGLSDKVENFCYLTQVNVVVKGDDYNYKRYPLMRSQSEQMVLPTVKYLSGKMRCSVQMVEYAYDKLIGAYETEKTD